jgi:lysophospholipase L1-like esterase
MRKKIIHQITTSRSLAPYSLLLLVTFIIAMKEPILHKKTSGKVHTYLALGDSYTIGEQVESRYNFPAQVTGLLNKKGDSFADPDIIAKTGWTTDELQQAIQQANPGQGYDFVTLLIGVNNQYRGRKIADYMPEFESLLKQAIQFAGNQPGHVIVLSIPDWGVTPFAAGRDRNKIAREIDEYNAANQEIALRYGAHYIDITPSTRESVNDHSLLAPDGLHPSGKEYERWAEKIAACITSTEQ